MNFTKTNVRAALILGVVCSFPAITHAVPSLQLGITGGTYNSSTQTIVASDNLFTLNTYLVPDATAPLNGNYYISFAVTPQVTTPLNLGSFTINGTSIDITQDMALGTPPLDAYDPQHDPGDLATHDVFPTYFGQMGFHFNGAQSAQFNTQDNPGQNPLTSVGTGMYFEQFLVDVTDLDPRYAIHFDLYNTTTSQVCLKQKKGQCIQYSATLDTDILSFAPFSHDAESGKGGGGRHNVPEPASLALLGIGLIGLGAASKRRAV